MVFYSHRYFIFLWIQVNIIQSTYVRYLSSNNSIHHLNYYSKFKWFYVASINSISIYDQYFTLIQNISIENSLTNIDNICRRNSCQCLTNHSNQTLNSNLILYFERKYQINNQPYLIDCWSLQTGSCIIRNALNLSEIYYQSTNTNEQQKFLFNSDLNTPNHIFPFDFKYQKCSQTPTYLFLTSTLRKTDDSIDEFYRQCLEQSQRRTIALRALNFNDKTRTLLTTIDSSIMKRHTDNFIDKTRPSNTNISLLSLKNSYDHVTNVNNKTSSSINFTWQQGPFLNINDYCPEQLSVVRSIYTDFFERESSDKFRVFQDIIHDEFDSAIYVFTNQQNRSKIIRLCEGQISFRHYVEIEINCGHEYTLVEKVQLIQLKNQKQYLLTIASKPNSHSAICLYDFEQIRNTFVENINDLAKGNISLGMAWLHGESVIPQYPTPYGNLARCSTTRDASYLMIYEGPKQINSDPLIAFDFDRLTSLEATIVNNYIVILSGTADGKIKKISVEMKNYTTVQFEELFVHFGESILRDLILDDEQRFLYGATKSRMFQIDLHDCDRYKTCHGCLSSQNPYCGWATTLNRCTIRTNNIRRFTWLQIHDNCPNILDITPGFLSKSKSTHLKLKVDSIPDDLTSTYSCSFGFIPLLAENDEINLDEIVFKSNATKSDNAIQCYSPSAETLANITHDSIILRLLYNDIVLTEKNLTFYDCSSYLSCTSCMNNTFACSWDLLSSTCMDTDLIVERNRTIITNSSVEQCPRYRVSTDEIFIADSQSFILGSENRVTIRTIAMNFRVQKYFQCALSWNNGSVVTAVGRIYNNLLICEPFRISFEKDIGQQQLSFDVQWRECLNNCTYKNLEALSNFTVNIYKCKYLADSCGSCILLYENYHCIWCETDKSCRHEINSTICKSNHIISSSMGICPDPRLRQIYPTIGPQYGQTPIQIYGSSLGKKPEDISVVLINSNQTTYPCHIQNQSYVTAQSFICQPPSLPIGIYTIKVTVHSVLSKDRPTFQIVKPIIKDVYPSLGPKSGGTLLSIKGKHLTIGNQINVFVGDQRCVLIENENSLINSSMFIDDETVSLSLLTTSSDNDDEILQCRTSKLNNENHSRHHRLVKRQTLWTGTIRILIDNFTETYSNITYSYTEDPRVYNLSRYAGIQSGGLSFVVHGANFDSIQVPQFFLESYQNRLTIENCSVKTPSTLLCFGPSLKWFQNETRTSLSVDAHEILRRSIIQSHCQQFQFGFLMDDVESLRNTSTYSQTFQLCPDPIIFPFNNNGRRIQYRYDYLTIEGMNLLDVATINDYSIAIGSYPCNITSISDKQIVCQPTNHTIEKFSRKKRTLLQMSSGDHDQAIVRVTLGRRIYTLGTLTYTSNNDKRSLILYYIIASTCGFLLTISIIVISILFRRLNTKRTRQLHRLQNQIDTLEMRVARECKEAFAELQTDIGEMTNDLSHSGVPYNDYQIFCMKILFPNANEEEKYMILHQIEIPIEPSRRKSVRQGLQLLSQSLYNRHFLLLIIRTLEMDRLHFRLQDRMKFASLLSLLFQDNIEYLTDILKILLRDLIEKTIQQDRNNAKILLRSNASIAEKMLANWFAFLLFDYTKERLGSPLYILFQSIKQQIQKGPIDCFTNESRYSLSEDKLLRQHVDYSSMIVYVIQIEDDKSHLTTTPVPIKVLSCDSIRQVKEKIVDHFYKNIPFSKRPIIDEFDLEWRTGSHMKLLRDDERFENPDSNGFIQVPTLASYQVHDGARLFLSLKRGTNPTNTSSTNSSKSHLSCLKTVENEHNWQSLNGTENQILLNSTVDLSNSKKDQRTINIDQSLSNARLYHLVKSIDREDDDRTFGVNKLVSEVYLTRLLATKGSLQQYIDNFFEKIFCLNDIPMPIKYLFDFLDEQADYYQINDPNIVHTWKSNSLPLRFFVNIIKNPDFLFDVQKTNVIDASLSVIAQMFMDSCAAGTHQLTKDSPSSKLLFYRDVQKYKKLAEKYYDTITVLPNVSVADFDNKEQRQSNGFNRNYVLYKLYDEYLSRYKNSLHLTMTNDYSSKQYRFAALFEQIVNLMENFEIEV